MMIFGFASIPLSILVIFLAAFLSDDFPIPGAILGFSFFPIALAGLILLIKCYIPMLMVEINWKKKNFDSGGIKEKSIDLNLGKFKDYLNSLGFKRHNVLHNEFYYKTKPRFEKYILSGKICQKEIYPYKLVFFFEQEDFESALRQTISIFNDFSDNRATQKLQHRLVIVICVKKNIDFKDREILKKYVSYNLVGEIPRCRTPILLPLLYDEDKKLLCYKGNKIRFGQGSTFNYSLRFIKKLLKQWNKE